MYPFSNTGSMPNLSEALNGALHGSTCCYVFSTHPINAGDGRLCRRALSLALGAAGRAQLDERPSTVAHAAAALRCAYVHWSAPHAAAWAWALVARPLLEVPAQQVHACVCDGVWGRAGEQGG